VTTGELSKSVNFGALIIAAAIPLAILALAAAAVFSGSVRGAVSSAFISNMEQWVGGALILYGFMFARLAGRGETSRRPYYLRALLVPLVLYLVVHAVTTPFLLLSGMKTSAALLGPLFFFILFAAFGKSLLAAAATLLALIAVIVGITLTIAHLYWRLQRLPRFQSVALAPNHLKAALITAAVAAVLTLSWEVANAFFQGRNLLGAYWRLQALGALTDVLGFVTRTTLIVVAVAYYTARSAKPPELLTWCAAFAVGVVAIALTKTVLLVSAGAIISGNSVNMLSWVHHGLGATVFSVAVGAIMGVVYGYMTGARFFIWNKPVAA